MAESLAFLVVFGEYCIYVNDNGENKTLFLLCDDNIFMKKFPAICEFASQNEGLFSTGFPYSGAKEHFIVDIENIEMLGKLLRILIPLCSPPKHKKQKVH